MSNNNNKQLGEAPWFHVIISTGFGAGFFPGAPGTFAGFIGLVVWYMLYLFLSPTALTITTLALIVGVTIVGIWTSNVMERYWGKDPRAVVIDEYVGTWIPLLVAPCGEYTWAFALLGFALFRLIDIFKPLGCRKVEDLCPGGYGVMFDDVLAGTYALIILWVVKSIAFA
jgi:phosphatidylglycerophosphatase A